MHFSATPRVNPATGRVEPYLRLKETYRDESGTVRSRILLSPEFIKDLSAKQIRDVSLGLTYRMEHKNQPSLFETESHYDPIVQQYINDYWDTMVMQNKIDVDKQKDRKRIETERNLLIADSLENKDAREIGTEWCCHQTIEKLQIPSFLKEQGWDDEFIKKALSLLVTRTVYQSSEHKSMRIMSETSNICELYNLDETTWNKYQSYKIPLAFYAIKDQLESHLSRVTNHLFNIEDRIILFDLTNTYFEGRKSKSKLAKFGRSKEKRSY